MKVKLYLRSTQNKDGTHTIFWNLYNPHTGERARFTTHQTVRPEHWDKVNSMPLLEKEEELFTYLYNERKKWRDIFTRSEGSVRRARDEYEMADKKVTLREGLEYVKKSSSKKNTWIHWQSGVNSFERVFPGIHMEDITTEKVERWKAHCYQVRGNSHGGVRSAMSALRKIYHYCAYMGLFKAAQQDPFRNKPRTPQGVEKEEKALSLEELRDFLKSKHEYGYEEHLRSRDIVLLCLLLRGIDYIDLVSIKTQDLTKDGNYINIGRIKNEPDQKNPSTAHKYNRKMKIWLSPVAKKLIEKYRGDDEYLFNFYMRDCSLEENYHSYKQNLSRHNKRTKRLGENAGITTPVTTKVIRHTFATIAEETLNSVRNTGVLMGHSVRGIVTEDYLAKTKQHRIDEWHQAVLTAVFGDAWKVRP